MHRLSRAQIEDLISVTLATAPDLVKQRLRSKLTADKDWARAELAELIAAKVDNDSSMVVVTEMLGTLPYDQPGEWDVDEPAPELGKRLRPAQLRRLVPVDRPGGAAPPALDLQTSAKAN